jgi:hypothetical protein
VKSFRATCSIPNDKKKEKISQETRAEENLNEINAGLETYSRRFCYDLHRKWAHIYISSTRNAKIF